MQQTLRSGGPLPCGTDGCTETHTHQPQLPPDAHTHCPPCRWVEAARSLACHAALVTAEGGEEAAHEAPTIYAAMDALAARAAAWAERRQRQVLDQVRGWR
jgi:hypothetical protein